MGRVLEIAALKGLIGEGEKLTVHFTTDGVTAAAWLVADLDRELARLLRQARCRFVRAGKGSHQIWFSPTANRNFAAPLHQKPAHREWRSAGCRPSQSILI
jgi:hypothetical protein